MAGKINQQLLTVEPLRVEEFWPTVIGDHPEKKARFCKFGNFESVLEQANEWLARHPAFQVLNVETSERRVTQRTEASKDGMQFNGHHSNSIYLRGLRIWLNKGGHDLSQGFSVDCRLTYLDLMPEKIERLQYETLDTVINRFNANSPKIAGRVLTIETVSVTLPARLLRRDGSGYFDPHHSRYTDYYQRHRLYFLRLWYIMGETARVRIGIHDIKPRGVKGISPDTMLPLYADFDTLYPLVGKWSQTNPDKRITNIQTVDCRYGSDPAQRLRTLTTLDIHIEERPRVFFLRVAWMTSLDEPVTSSHHDWHGYTFRANINKDLSRLRHGIFLTFEGLFRTVGRISVRLEQTGDKPLGAQVLTYPQIMLATPLPTPLNTVSVMPGDWEVNDDETDTEGKRLNTFQVVRVYMGSRYTELEKEYNDRPYVWKKKSCVIL